jgi:hypothetical protein
MTSLKIPVIRAVNQRRRPVSDLSVQSSDTLQERRETAKGCCLPYNGVICMAFEPLGGVFSPMAGSMMHGERLLASSQKFSNSGFAPCKLIRYNGRPRLGISDFFD